MPIFQLFHTEMPNQARTHLDMLQLCCGICGEKKNPKILSHITEYILNQIKAIDGYQNYDLKDDRYPKVICQKDRRAVREKATNPFEAINLICRLLFQGLIKLHYLFLPLELHLLDLITLIHAFYVSRIILGGQKYIMKQMINLQKFAQNASKKLVEELGILVLNLLRGQLIALVIQFKK